MWNVFRRTAMVGVLLVGGMGLSGLVAEGQAVPLTGLDKQLERIDFAVAGEGEFTSSVTGVNYLKATLKDSPSNTLGALLTLRYTAKPLVGFELNYGYARYTQNFSQYIVGGVQANADEYTLGYVAHPRKIFGLQPFLGAGGGSIAFKPTTYGGQGLKTQARAVYYYNVGVEDYVYGDHVGLRAQFRQLVYLAPDFGQNYLTITRRALGTEPSVGFFLRF